MTKINHTPPTPPRPTKNLTLNSQNFVRNVYFCSLPNLCEKTILPHDACCRKKSYSFFRLCFTWWNETSILVSFGRNNLFLNHSIFPKFTFWFLLQMCCLMHSGSTFAFSWCFIVTFFRHLMMNQCLFPMLFLSKKPLDDLRNFNYFFKTI